MHDSFACIPEEQFTHIEGTPFDLAEVYYRPDAWSKERRFIVIRKLIPVKSKDNNQK